MATNLTTEHEQELIDAFGRAFLAWQRVEVQLFFLFKVLLRGKDDRITSAAFHSVLNLNT
jgi:hypothetical protein